MNVCFTMGQDYWAVISKPLNRVHLVEWFLMKLICLS